MLIRLFLYFYIFGFIGWCAEVIYASYMQKKFVNRGILNGPICPIYGCGVAFICAAVMPMSHSVIMVFVLSVIIASSLEWITGFVLEKLFNTKWWDYSDIPFNLNGYICLPFSLIWGIGGVMIIKLILPVLDMGLSYIPYYVKIAAICVLSALLVADIIATVVSIVGIKRRLRRIKLIAHELKEGSDKLGKLLSDGTISLKDKYDEYHKSIDFLSHHRIFKAFPNLKLTSGKREISFIQEKVEQFKGFAQQVSDVQKKASEKRKQIVEETYQPKLEEGKEPPFAHGLCLDKYIWLFIIGCVTGCILETLWVIVVKRKIELRVGLVYGPFIPVYGIGAVCLTLFLHKLYAKRDMWILCFSAIVGAAVEFVCSYLQELIFGTVSWDYSGTLLNLDGRTNIMFALLWGVLGVLWVKDMYPRISKIIEKIPRKVGTALTLALCVFLIFDMLISGIAVIRQTERDNGIPPSNTFEEYIDRQFNDDYMNRVFPNMKSVDSDN